MTDLPSSPIERLIAIMARLRNPEGGCPWDLEQDFASIAPYTIEEAYEVDDAIRRGDMDDLKDELGDLLLQVVYHAQMASEGGLFDFHGAALSSCEKMIARHPHVFGEEAAAGAEDVIERIWEERKAAEREAKNWQSALDGVALALPALMRAQKLQKRAALIGFDWPSTKEVMDKIEEELAELKEALAGGSEDHVREEYGDLLFAFVNLGRKLGVDTELALRETNNKFDRRFRGMESSLKQRYEDLSAVPLEEMERHWVLEKLKERTGEQPIVDPGPRRSARR